MAEGTRKMRQRERTEQRRPPIEQAGKRRQMLQDAREYRMRCYRRMQLADMADGSYEDYSVQEYWQERTIASANAARLLDYIDIHKNKWSSEEQSEFLLTAFVAMNAGFYDYEQFIRATEMVEMLLPTLPDNQAKFYLQAYLQTEPVALVENVLYGCNSRVN